MEPVFELKAVKDKIKGVSIGYLVAMVTSHVQNISKTFSDDRRFVGINFVRSNDK